MNVSDLMTTELTTITPERSMKDAANLMASADTGWLPVLDHDGKLTGVLTDRDLAVRGVGRSRHPDSTEVREVMSKEVRCVGADQDVEEAVRIMQVHQIRRIAVTDDDDRVVGVVSLADLVRGSESERLGSQTLERVSEPAAS